MRKDTITFRVSEEHKAELQKIAAANKRTLGDVLRLLIADWLQVIRVADIETKRREKLDA